MKRMLLASVAVCALVGVAQSADLGAMPVKAPPPVAAPPLWAGAYIGIQGGVVRQHGRVDDLDGYFNSHAPMSHEADATGGTIGGHLGYNWQSDRIVYGLEGDASWVRARIGTTFCDRFCSDPFLPVQSQDVQWLATARARLGVAFDATLLYVTGGAAFAGVKNSAIDGSALAGFTDNKTRVGWVVGGGIEQMLGRNWTVRGEVRYVDLGKETVTDASWGTAKRGQFSNSLLMGLVGASYRF